MSSTEMLETFLGVVITLPIWVVLYHVFWRPWMRR